MANLLPLKTKKRNNLLYTERLISVLCIIASGVVLVAIALFIPHFILVKSSAEAARRVIIEHTDTAPSTLSKREIDRKIVKIVEPRERMNIYELIAEIERIHPENVIFTDIVYNKKELKVKNAKSRFEHEMTLRGISADRESLVLLLEQIQAIDRISGAELPVSQLAKNTDIEFDMTFSIKPLK